MKKWKFLILMLCFFPCPIFAQSNDQFEIDRFINDLFDQQEANVSYEDLYESLLTLHQSPLNINSASVEQLKNTHLLSTSQIANLHSYIQDRGKLITLYELQVIEGFDFETIQNLVPFVMADPKDAVSDNRPLLVRIATERNNYLISRFERVLETKRGFTEADSPENIRYAGSASKLYLRYRVSKSGDFSFGFTTEKDPGEAIVWDADSKRYGLDFWSFHAMLENQGKIKKVILGDYQLQLGQGLLLGAGFGVGKGSETINTIQRVSLGIRPYSSVLESGFLRGAAATYKITNEFNLSVFYSNLKLDANINEASDETQAYFSSIQSSGFHRTPSEIANKSKVAEQVIGVNVNFKSSQRFEIGTTFLINQFDIPIQRQSQPYNLHEFSGNTNINASLYSDYNWRGFSLFGEIGISKSGGVGSIAGFTKNLSPRIEFALLLRNYARNFHSFRGNSFGENSRNINETGIYWGLKYTLNREFFLSAYFDTYKFPYLKFGVNAPSIGKDYLIRLNYNPGRGVKMYTQVRRETKEVNSSAESSPQIFINPGTKDHYLVNVDFDASYNLRLKSRVQWSRYELIGTETNGIAYVQDASYNLGSWTFSGRIAFFDTHGNQNRQYVYERDVLYAFSIPAYSGRGIRNYLLIQYKFSRKLDLWGRLSRTTFYDRNEIGTGLEIIDGEKRTELKIQARYKLN